MCPCGFVVFIIACAAEGMVSNVGNSIVLSNDSDRPDLCLVSYSENNVSAVASEVFIT